MLPLEVGIIVQVSFNITKEVVYGCILTVIFSVNFFSFILEEKDAYSHFFTIISYASISYSQYNYYTDAIPNNYSQSNANTGKSIAMSEDWLFVGIPGYDKPAYYVPPFNFPAFTDAGAVDVYHKNVNGDWEYYQRILPMAAVGSYAYFGSSIDVSENRVIIGAPGANSERGFASVYTFSGNNWVLSNTFNPGTQSIGDKFGYSVAIDGDCVVIGSPGKDKIDYSTNPVTTYTNFGLVYHYRDNGSQYLNLGTKTFSTFFQGNGQLGFAVDVKDAQDEIHPGCRVIAGAPYAKEQNGYEVGTFVGYKIWDGNSIINEGEFYGTSTSQLGYALSLYCNTYLIQCFGGFVYENSRCWAAVGAPGTDIVNTNSGMVGGYFLDEVSSCNLENYSWSSSPWLEPYQIVPPAGSRLGSSVSMNGISVISGAPYYNNIGATYIYRQVPITGHYVALNIITNPNQQTYSNYGFAVAVPSNITSEIFTGAASCPYYDWLLTNNVGLTYSINEL